MAGPSSAMTRGEDDGGTKFTRPLRTRARPKEASAEIMARIDAEAELGLENIKRKVELRKR